MKKFLCAILISLSLNAYCTDTLSVCSPSGKICVKIWMAKEFNFRVYENGLSILEPSRANLLLANNESFSDNNRIKSHSIKKVNSIIISPVPEKRKRIKDHYNLLSIVFSKPYKIEIRAYDDGVAYRFITSFKDSIIVQNEIASFHFPVSSAAWFPSIHKREDADIFHTSFEELYPLRQLDSIKNSEVGYTPVLVAPPSNPKIGIAESGLEDYPGMFLKGTASDVLEATFAAYPLEEKMTNGQYPQSIVTKRAGYIARTKGTRTFPWRALIIADQDKDLPANDIVYRLASPSRIGDASWVNPGKGTERVAGKYSHNMG
ncbi:MAG: glycoside hydrolase family 97 N-terminal domain-containing protein [Ginsengibacter sp.]